MFKSYEAECNGFIISELYMVLWCGGFGVIALWSHEVMRLGAMRILCLEVMR